MRHPWHRTDLPWADVVLDLREQHRTDLPDTHCGIADPDRAVTIEGWTATPYVMPGGPPGGSISVLTITAPDGWRGALVLNQYSGKKFSYLAFRRTLPYLGRVLSPRNTNPNRIRLLRQRTLDGFPALREAMNNPHGWDSYVPEDESDMPATLEYIVTWSSCDVAAEDAAVLYDYQVDPVQNHSYGNGRSSLLDWYAAGFADAHEVALWTQAGVTMWQYAVQLQASGLDAETAYAWLETPLPTTHHAYEVADFVAAGWTPGAVRALCAHINASTSPQSEGERATFYELVEAWGSRMHPADASVYLEAGWTLEEFDAARAAGRLPDRDSVVFLGALRPPLTRAQWVLANPNFNTGGMRSPAPTVTSDEPVFATT